MKIIIFGSGQLLIKLLNECTTMHPAIEIIGVCNLSYKPNVKEFTQRELEQLGIKSIELDKKELKKADLILSINCPVILPPDIVNSFHIVNMHFGILPKYRGNSANTWAIMNGESHVGFTIHRMTDMLDAGDIYFVGKIPIKRSQTYSDVYDELIDAIVTTTPKVIEQIHLGSIVPVEQEGDYVYCTLFFKEMGYIRNFDLESEYIYNLFRCMSRPHGTGIYFFKNEIKFEARKVFVGTDRCVCDYIGIPGKIVYIYDNMIWIKTHDNVVLFGDIVDENEQRVDVHSVFKIGQSLG